MVWIQVSDGTVGLRGVLGPTLGEYSLRLVYSRIQECVVGLEVKMMIQAVMIILLHTVLTRFDW